MVRKATEDSELKSDLRGPALLLFGFGLYLIICGVQSIAQGHWSIFMPLQLAAIGGLLSMISEHLGAYLGGAITIALGIACAGLGVAALVKRDGHRAQRLATNDG
jgi:hypothetical protein